MSELFQSPPFSIPSAKKEPLLLKEIETLTHHHRINCQEYDNLFNRLKLQQPPYQSMQDIPALPVNLFKKYQLKSIPEKEIYKVLLSSGTTQSSKSRICLDLKTSKLQTQALASILTDFLGNKRLPILIVDEETVFSDPGQFSARGAALLGMLNFGADPFYLLEGGQIRREALFRWLKKYQSEPILIFGLTFLVWEYFLKALQPGEFEFPKAFLFHTGGWKKMEAQSVSNEEFKLLAKERAKISKCHNFYGFVEQVGSIFVECEQGFFHSSNFSEVIIRNPKNQWKESNPQEEGIVQSISVLPWSYPGHSLLTEDIGKWFDIDSCKCGRKGKTFIIIGRIPRSEPRGCSDVIS